MKAQVIVTPLPIGSKMKKTVAENYEQLLVANNKNVPETQWWNHYLVPLEAKYNLLYHTGKTVFQIYYPQGKNKAANKEINQTISNVVKKINNNWQEIIQATNSFEVYRQEKLKPSLDVARAELTKIITEQQKNAPESSEYKELVTQQEALINAYKTSEPVVKMDEEYRQYQERIKKQIEVYLEKETDFKSFVETLKFSPEPVLVKEK